MNKVVSATTGRTARYEVPRRGLRRQLCQRDVDREKRSEEERHDQNQHLLIEISGHIIFSLCVE
jgi:hypothetical protein